MERVSKRVILLFVVFLAVLLTGCSDKETDIEDSQNLEQNEIMSGIRKAETNEYLLERMISYQPTGEIISDTKYTYYQNGAYKSMDMELPLGGDESGITCICYEEPQGYGTPQLALVSGNSMGGTNILSQGYYMITYDDNWRMIKQEMYDLTMTNIEETTTITYDVRGNIIEESSTGSLYKSSSTYEYDEYNVLVKKTNVSETSDGNETNTYTYTYDYDANGLPKYRYTMLNGKNESITKIYRDDAGLVSKEEVTTNDGKTSVTEYTKYLTSDYITKYYLGEDSSETDNNITTEIVTEENPDVITGSYIFAGILGLDGLSCYLQLDEEITYLDPVYDEPITTSVLWLSEGDSASLLDKAGTKLSIEGSLFNFQGNGELMFNAEPYVFYDDGTPIGDKQGAEYQNWDTADNQTRFNDAMNVLQNAIYKSNDVWQVKTLCDISLYESINNHGFQNEYNAVDLSINDSWVNESGYDVYVMPYKTQVKIIFKNKNTSEELWWYYDWQSALIDGSTGAELSDFVVNAGLAN